MSNKRPEFIRIGLRKRGASIKLKLRWDRSPLTCAAVVSKLPIENQVFHAKFANNEIYTLVPVFDDPPLPEWHCVYPAPGDLMYLPITPGIFIPPGMTGAPKMDPERGMVDLAYFYDRGNNLMNGPMGPCPGHIFATGISIDDMERMAVACSDVWFSGAADETLFLEVG